MVFELYKCDIFHGFGLCALYFSCSSIQPNLIIENLQLPCVSSRAKFLMFSLLAFI